MAHLLVATRYVATASSAAALLLASAGLARAETADERSLRGAAYNGQVGDVKRLLSAGTDPNVPNHGGLTAVHHAALKANAFVLELLLEAGGDPDAASSDGNIPLHFAASFEFERFSQQAIRVLLDYGAAPDLFNEAGQSPLHLVARRHRSELSIVHLLGAGADPNRTDRRGDTPLHYAISRYSRFSPGIVAALVDHGAKADLAGADGETPLQRFARLGRNDGGIVAALVDGGGDPNRKNPDGETPLHTTIRNGGSAERPGVVEALLQLGADPCIRDGAGYIPYNAARKGSTVRVMLADAGGSAIGCLGSIDLAGDYVIDPADWPGELTTRANVRAGPGTIYDVVSTFDGGVAVQVVGTVRNSDWLLVEVADGKAFVHGSLVREVAGSTVREPGAQ